MWRRKRMLQSLDQEIREHIQMATQEYIDRGMSPEEARYAALRKFGSVTRVKQDTREVWNLVWLEQLAQDIRMGLRMLCKSPGFTCVTVLTLALGIGANTAIFSLVNGLLLNPTSIDHPERLVALRVRYEKLNLKSIEISAPDFDLARENRKVFESVAMEEKADFNYTAADWPERLRGAKISSRWFEVFGAKPLLGRVFTPEEDQPHADHEVVLSYNTWKALFGADNSIVGRSIQLNEEPYTVVGVMRSDFHWPDQTDLWAPLALAADEFAVGNIFNESYLGVARLQPGVGPVQAAAYLDVVTQRVVNDPRSPYPRNSGWGMFSVPFTEFEYGDMQAPLLILMGAVGFVLLIACANVAGLLLARASGRAREFAVRTALGASSWRLVRQMLTESVVLATAGMATGLLIASGAISGLGVLASKNLSMGLLIPMDAHVLWFTAGVAGVSAIVFGLAPALQFSRMDPQQNLQEGRGAGSASRAHHRMRDLLVAGQIAIALVLLAGAGIFLKSLSKMQEANVGFRPHGLMTAATALPEHPYDSPAKQIEFVRDVLERLSSAPGVVSAAAGVPLPFSGFNGSASFEIEGSAKLPGDPGPHGNVREVSPGYFETMGITVIRGRTFTAEDRQGAQAVAIIDENLARLYWPDGDALGKHLKINTKDPWATIVGVVAPVRHSQVVGEESSGNMSESSGKGVYYFPMYQTEAPAMFLIARANGNPSALAETIRQSVHATNANQPVSDLKTMEERIALSMGPRRAAVALLSVFAAMALMLASIGLFGLVRYNVMQRIQEIGIRMALGAQRGDVLKMVIGKSARLIAGGISAGMVLALLLTHIMGNLLYVVSPADPATFAGTAILLAGVALLACYIPARRAMRVDPMVALRYE
jgi:predicted permease